MFAICKLLVLWAGGPLKLNLGSDGRCDSGRKRPGAQRCPGGVQRSNVPCFPHFRTRLPKINLLSRAHFVLEPTRQL